MEQLLREIHAHHALTTAFNSETPKLGHIFYRHKKSIITCPHNNICTNQSTNYSVICFGESCVHSHSRIYVELECGHWWFLGYNFRHAHQNMICIKSIVSSHVTGYGYPNCEHWDV